MTFIAEERKVLNWFILFIHTRLLNVEASEAEYELQSEKPVPNIGEPFGHNDAC
jgi:hypothetical protein